jgi:hypothetical protein
MVEPVVRIRCPSPEDAALARSLLAAGGLAAEEQLTWLLVREADPDAVNDLLVAGGALSRTAAREQIGKLLGYLIDRQGDLAGRGANLQQLVQRTLAEAGLGARYTPRDEGELLQAGVAAWERLLSTGAERLPWEGFVAAFCRARSPGPAA